MNYFTGFAKAGSSTGTIETVGARVAFNPSCWPLRMLAYSDLEFSFVGDALFGLNGSLAFMHAHFAGMHLTTSRSPQAEIAIQPKKIMLLLCDLSYVVTCNAQNITYMRLVY